MFNIIKYCCIGIMILFSPKNYGQSSQQIKELKVIENLNPQKIVKNAADKYVKKRAKDFVAKIYHEREVKSLNKYLEFNAISGLISILDRDVDIKKFYFQTSANNIRFSPLSCIRTNQYTVKGDTLETNALLVNNENAIGSYNYHILSYMNLPDKNLILALNCVELFSPLNPAMSKFYKYTSYSVNETNSSIKISFESKPDVFPKKTKLYCNGYLMFDIRKRIVEKIVIEDYIDFYSSYVRKSSMPDYIGSSHILEINFNLIKDVIFPQSVKRIVKWKQNLSETVKESQFIYTPIISSRRNPFNNNIIEDESILFFCQKVPSKSEKEFVLKNMYNHFGGNFASFYSAPYRNDILDFISLSKLNQIINDINSFGDEDFYKQVEKNSNRGYYLYNKSRFASIPKKDFKNFNDFSINYYKNTQKIIDYLYNKNGK